MQTHDASGIATSVDQLCDRFERALRDGERPDISDWLAEAGTAASQALPELAAVELEFRLCQGEKASAAEYFERFPALRDDTVAVRRLAALESSQSEREARKPDDDTVTFSAPRAGNATESTVVLPPTGDRAGLGGSTAGGGRFRVLRLHAKGGLGQVHIARDEKLRRQVALKEIRPDRAADAQLRQRFVTEAEITGQLEHPGIVPIYALDEDVQGRPYYAMRFIQGRTLADAIRDYYAQPTPLSFRELLQRFVTVCQTMAYAHSQGVIHRDLKPANIMLGDYGETLVVDWGLAKHWGSPAKQDPDPSSGPRATPAASGSCDHGLTEAGDVLGTPAYMSPEQATGKIDELGPASDIYSLGATLYPILTNHAPLETGDPATLFDRVAKGEFPRPRQRNRAVPKALEAICLKAMALAPAHRYASARDLAAELERWQADEPVAAYREPLPDRARRWLRKHPKSVAALVAAVVVGVISLGTTAIVVAGKNQKLEIAYIAEHNAKGLADRKRFEAEKAREAEEAAKFDAQAKQIETEAARADEAEARQRAEGVTDVLVKSFRSPDPKRDGRTITMAEVLDRSVKDMEDKFADDPQTKAALLEAIGDSYFGLGLYRESIPVYEKVNELYLVTKDAKDASALADKLAAAYYGTGQSKKAVAVWEFLYEQRKEKLGPKHPLTLGSLNNLAQVYQSMGQLDRALPLLEKSLDLLEEKEGPDDPITIAPRVNVATVYESTGQLARAIPLYEKSLALAQATAGPKDPNTLLIMNHVGRAYQSAGQLDRALPLLEESAGLIKEVYGPEHPETWTCINNLAVAYEDADRVDEALLLYEELVKSKRDKLGTDHPEFIADLSALACEYLQARQGAKAIPLFDEYIARQRTRLQNDEAKVAQVLGNVSGTLLKYQEHATAEKYLRECLEKSDRATPDHWKTFILRTMLGSALSGQKKYEEAESLLLTGYEGLKQRQEMIPIAFRRTRLQEALERLIRHYESAGKADEAQKWQVEIANLPPNPAPGTDKN